MLMKCECGAGVCTVSFLPFSPSYSGSCNSAARGGEWLKGSVEEGIRNKKECYAGVSSLSPCLCSLLLISYI